MKIRLTIKKPVYTPSDSMEINLQDHKTSPPFVKNIWIKRVKIIKKRIGFRPLITFENEILDKNITNNIKSENNPKPLKVFMVNNAIIKIAVMMILILASRA
jgi:hypothetical protein